MWNGNGSWKGWLLAILAGVLVLTVPGVLELGARVSTQEAKTEAIMRQLDRIEQKLDRIEEKAHDHGE